MVNKYDNYELKKATSLENVPDTIKDGDGYIWDLSGLPDKDFDDSKVPLEFRRLAIWMRSKLFGKEVRETIARLAELSGLIDDRQKSVETFLVDFLQSVTEAELNSGPEIVQMRDGETTANARLERDYNQLSLWLEGIATTKRDKHALVEMRELSQEVKSALTGGSTAIVGTDSVGNEQMKGHYRRANDYITDPETDLKTLLKDGNTYVLHTVKDNPTGEEAMLTTEISTSMEGHAVYRVKQIITSLRDNNNEYKRTFIINTGTGAYNLLQPWVSTSQTVTTEEKTINRLPYTYNKFGETVSTKVIYDGSMTHNNSTGAWKYDSDLQFEGKNTVRLTSAGSQVSISYPLGDRAEITQDYDYVDIYYQIDNGNNMSASQIDLGNNNDYANRLVYYYIGSTHNRTNDSGWQYMRIPLSDFNTMGSMDRVSTINYIKVTFSSKTGTTANINVAKVDFVKAKKGAVSIYFDDAYLTQYTNGFRIAEKYNITGAVGVITSWTNVRDNIMKWSHLREMEQAGWIIASHTHTHPRLRNLTDIERDYELKTSHDILKQQGFLFGARTYIAPFGSYDFTVDAIAKKYYSICRTETNSDRDNPLNEFPQSHPRRQKYISPYVTDTFETFKGWIDKAIDEKKELSLAFHPIDETLPDDQFNVMPEVFEQVCAYIAQKRDEGVLEVVDWRKTLTDSQMTAELDNDGLEYMVSGGKVLELPLNK